MGGVQSCKQWRKSKLNAPIGSVLDQVISQADAASSQCMLYRIANYKKGGELIDAYNTGGQREVEKLIREQFGVLMYCNGRGQRINRAEYLRWKYRDCEQVAVPIEASLSPHDPLSRWEDHEACWQMRYRGSLGESMLHVLIICDTRLHTRLARTLLRCFPRLALDVVEGEEYLGASALHLAIAYSNNELVQDLIEAGAIVNQRAIGSFFLPRDQQRSTPSKHTDYEGLAYLGEYPLAWAACCANESVYNLLLDNGADPDLCDSFGNMILHMVVVCDKLDLFGYALRHPKLPARNGILNNAGLTPLTLACTLGRAEVFREMLELSAKEFWRYSNITCSAYPLNALDTLLPDGRTNWNSALFIILNGTKEAHLDMLDGGIIQKLLEEKWKTYARKQFLKRLLILFIHLICLSMAVYLRPVDKNLLAEANSDSPNTIDEDEDDSVRTAVRYAFEVATILGVLSYVILQQGDEVKNQGLAAFLKQLTHAPAKAIFLVSNLLILCCIPCRLMGDRKTEEAILVFAVPGSWFLLMFFAGAVRLTGPFVTMIYSMITGDMLTFGIIYMIVLFGFSQSFFFLYKGFPNVKSTLYSSYPSTWMALFQITLGDYSYSDLSYTTYPNLSKTVFAIFMVFVPILLLNMLIAMMGNTYAHVIEQSEKEWMKQWAKIVVTLERAVSQTDLHKYLEEYSIAMGPSDDPRYEQRGVMVIKSKSKTRAKQRKGAVCNWKRVGKVTINELRKRNMTGEELRKIMWGRASICTPTKVPKKINPVDGTTLATGFDGALPSTFDAMSYAHDYIIDGAQGLQTMTNTASHNNVRLDETGKKDATGAPAKTARERWSMDPIRDLILMADRGHSTSSEAWTELVKQLATSAETAPSVETPQPPLGIAAEAQLAVADLFGMQTGLGKEAVLPPPPEPSDSDGPGEPPLLGRVSLIRRAKSAASRGAPKMPRASDRIPLFDADSETERTLTPPQAKDSKAKVTSKYIVDDERLQSIRSSTGNIYVASNNEPQFLDNNGIMEATRPSNIEKALLMACDPQAGNSDNNQTNSYTFEPRFKGKNRSKARPKTARNRITPMQNRGTASHSAPTGSPPDPLEPWATSGLADMNTILAWSCDRDDGNTDSLP